MSLVIDQEAAQLAHRLVWDSLSEAGLSTYAPLAIQSSSEEEPPLRQMDEEESEDDIVTLPPFLRGAGMSMGIKRLPAVAVTARHREQKTEFKRTRLSTAISSFGSVGQSDAVARALQSIPRIRSAWKKAVDTGLVQHVEGKAKVLPNQKFSCKQYTAEFVDWANQVTEVILSQESRTYGLRIEDNTVCFPQKAEDQEEAEGEEWIVNTPEVLGQCTIRVPADNRCTGCRRYFKTKTFQRQKDLAFFKCGCDRHRASHCVRCRVIQWALSVPLIEGSDEVDPSKGVACLGTGCRVEWTPADLFVVSVKPSAQTVLHSGEQAD